jgi:L-fucose mutarotase
MLKVPCIHTDILNTLAICGHGDKVLIADANYPIDSSTHAHTRKVYLNLTSGIPLVTDVLKVLDQTIAIEKVEIMVPDDGRKLPIHAEYQEIVQSVDHLDALGRFEFYDASKAENIKLAIVTGEPRGYANVLLTVGFCG